MKITRKLISRCDPLIKKQGDGSVMVIGYRRRPRSRKQGTYMLKTPQLLKAAPQKEAA